MARFWGVGSGGMGGTSPVFPAPDWPPNLAGPIIKARHFATVEQATMARGAAQAHPLGRKGSWIVYGVADDNALTPTATSD